MLCSVKACPVQLCIKAGNKLKKKEQKALKLGISNTHFGQKPNKAICLEIFGIYIQQSAVKSVQYELVVEKGENTQDARVR